MRGAHTSCSLNFHIYPLNRWMRNAMMSPGRCDDGGSVLMTTCRPCGCNSSKFVKTMRWPPLNHRSSLYRDWTSSSFCCCCSRDLSYRCCDGRLLKQWYCEDTQSCAVSVPYYPNKCGSSSISINTITFASERIEFSPLQTHLPPPFRLSTLLKDLCWLIVPLLKRRLEFAMETYNKESK